MLEHEYPFFQLSLFSFGLVWYFEAGFLCVIVRAVLELTL